MTPLNNTIIVFCDTSQKDFVVINGNILRSAKSYNENFRERNPVVALVEQGNKDIPTGSYIVCNYGHFDLESPFEFEKNRYCLPVDAEIYAIINSDGYLDPIQGNILIERVTPQADIELPDELKTPFYNRGIVSHGIVSGGNIKKGDFIFWLDKADYNIWYNWNGEDRQAIKVHETEITGYLK